MGQSASRRTHARTLWGNGEGCGSQRERRQAKRGGNPALRPGPDPEAKGIPGAESQDREHAGHHRECRRGWRESSRSREADHRGIAADGERGFAQLGPPSATEKGRGIQHQAGRESQRKKKLYWYTRLGTIAIEEQIFTHGRRGPQIRPFSESAAVDCRGYSEGLQRAMTDLGADNAFAGAAAKLKEHYGIEVPVSA